MSGNCTTPGSVSQETLSQSNSQIKLMWTMNSLCLTDGMNYQVTMSGSMYLTANGEFQNTGRVDDIKVYIPNLTIDFTDLNTDVTESFVFTETITLVFTYDDYGTVQTIGMTVTTNVEYNSNVYKLSAAVNLSANYFELSEGELRFYHPDYGYITYEVTAPFTYGCNDSSPDAGQVTITASNGTAIFTVNDCGNYTIDTSNLL